MQIATAAPVEAVVNGSLLIPLGTGSKPLDTNYFFFLAFLFVFFDFFFLRAGFSGRGTVSIALGLVLRTRFFAFLAISYSLVVLAKVPLVCSFPWGSQIEREPKKPIAHRSAKMVPGATLKVYPLKRALGSLAQADQ